MLQRSSQLYCPTELSSNLLSARSTDWAARHLQILDNEPQLHTDQLCALPLVSPGQTDGLRVDSKSLTGLGWKSAVNCTCQPPAQPVRYIPDTRGSLHTRPACVMHSGHARHCIHVRSAVHVWTVPPQGMFVPESHCFSVKNVCGSCMWPG